MNCKPGDLAFVFKSSNGLNLGKVVRCIRLATKDDRQIHRLDKSYGCVWIIDRPISIQSVYTGVVRLLPLFPDSCLKPIHPDTDGTEDESRAYLPPVPSITKITEPA